MPGWNTLKNLVWEEPAQSIEEGKNPADIESVRREYEAAGDDTEKLARVFDRYLELPIRADFPFNEPSDLESIHSLRQANRKPLSVNWSDDSLGDKMYGAWLGRCAGCALGKPVEIFMTVHEGIRSYQRTKQYLTAISPDEWPIRDYIPAHSPAEKKIGSTGCPLSTRETISFMESDDDIRYTVLGQIMMEKFGRDLTTWNVATTWIEQLPYKQVCTAETQAYLNLVNRYEFHYGQKFGQTPESIDWHWVATHQNPYREWIGAQIRIDSYAYAAPGNPELAAQFAWHDARLSHVKNGIYGAMFCAAMIAAAFATSEPLEIIEAGLGEIPTTSRLYSEIRQTIAICQKQGCDAAKFDLVIEEIYDLFEHYNAVYTNNNAALCVVALLLSKGDFAKGITLAVMGGWDTDCNGATVGSIVGAITGARKAPTHWTARLNDTLNSQIIDYHPIAISECARRSLEIAKKIRVG